jgi:hypothetical protein
MRVVLMLVLLSGCATQPDMYDMAYSQAESAKVLQKMHYCANKARQVPDHLKNLAYQYCLVTINATI